MFYLISIAVSAFSAFLAVRWIYFKILKLAKDKDLVDNPDARKLQKYPVPVVGGIAVVFGVTFGLLTGAGILFSINCFFNGETLSLTHLISIILAMFVMLYTGALDDIIGLAPKTRFIIEILVILGMILSTGICIDSLHGLWGVDGFSWWIGVPLTVVGGVGIINAINMVDGVNGLSSGLCITYCVLFGTLFVVIGDIPNAVLAFVMGGALVPFFIHNVFGDRSRMFIGDAGTMVMGIMMTWFVMSILNNGSTCQMFDEKGSVVAMVSAFLCVPVADTLRVMTVRMMKGKSPFCPDKTHLHHAFVALGISHSITALSIIVINLIVVGVWYLTVYFDAPLHCQLYTVIVVAATLVWGTYIFLNHEAGSVSKKAVWIKAHSIKTHLGKTEWWQRFSYFLDAPEFNEHEREDLRIKLENKFVNR
jgi:UDP-N-acetylmuramyl pentapeptide phosphotransferase/UDP-N-acetylglucosamine-1-phosphate transferase